MSNCKGEKKSMIAFFTRFIASITAFFLALAAFFGFNPGETPKEKEIQNVILFIGDGMGPLHLEKAKQERNISLTMDTFPQQGFAMTHSATDDVTDSAAGATALACGVKTYNSGLGVYWSEAEDFDKENITSYPRNITERCMENGMKTGIVTTDTTSGATPAGFSIHTSSRDNEEDISRQQLASSIDLIWGKDDEYITESAAAEAGYTYIDTIEEMNAVTSEEKSVGQFTDSTYHTYNVNDYTPTLSQMTTSAINLLDTSDNGFFLMVEGAHIDKKSHDNNDEKAMEAVEEFDNAIEKALEFAQADGHTMIVVTADHETGGIVLNDDGTYSFTRASHSAANVPVRVYGNYNFIENGEVIENTQIPIKIANALEFPDATFPREIIAQQTN